MTLSVSRRISEIWERIRALFFKLRSANRYCWIGQSTLPSGISGRVCPRYFHGLIASLHARTYSGGSSQITASALVIAFDKRLGPPSNIHASFSISTSKAASISRRLFCCQFVRSLIASNEITGTSGRTTASRAARWLFPTPFAPVTIIFFKQRSQDKF